MKIENLNQKNYSVKKEYLVIDGNNLLYSSYHAFKKINLDIPNGTTFFFLKVLISLLKRKKYQNLIIFFDGGGKNWRKEIIFQYKKKRPGMPEELLEQAKIIKSLLKNTRVPIFELENYEADDLIASFIKKNKNHQKEFSIFTRDKDFLQLVDDRIKIIKYMNGKLFSYTKENFYNEFLFQPLNYVDYLSLVGDNSDDIDGIKGIGPINAKKLVQKFNSIHNIYQNFSSLPENFRRMLKNKKDFLEKNKKVIKLSENIDLDSGDSNFCWTDWRKNYFLHKFCQANEFKSILKILN